MAGEQVTLAPLSDQPEIESHASACIEVFSATLRDLSSATTYSVRISRPTDTEPHARLVDRFHLQAKEVSKLLQLGVVVPGPTRRALAESLVLIATDTANTIASGDILIQTRALELTGSLLNHGRYVGCSPSFDFRPLWRLLLKFHVHPSNFPDQTVTARTSTKDQTDDSIAAQGLNVQLIHACAPQVRVRHARAILSAVHACRKYFVAGAVSALLDLTVPTMRRENHAARFTALELLSHFLPSRQACATTNGNIESLDNDNHVEDPEISIAQLDELFEIWRSISLCSQWDALWTSIIWRVCRRSSSATGRVYQQFTPFVVDRVLDALRLPVNGDGAPDLPIPDVWLVDRNSTLSHVDIARSAGKLLVRLVVHEQSSATTAADEDEDKSGPMECLSRFFSATSTFFHPSNAGRWSTTLGKLLYALCEAITKHEVSSRVRRMQHDVSRSSAELATSKQPIFDGGPLVSLLAPHLKNAFLSAKQNSWICHLAGECITLLAGSGLHFDILEEQFLNILTFALDPSTLDQSHLAPAALSQLSDLVEPLGAFGRLLPMMPNTLLAGALPGIDAADNIKTFAALRLFRCLLVHVPICAQPVTKDVFEAALVVRTPHDSDCEHSPDIAVAQELRTHLLQEASKSVTLQYSDYLACVDALQAWAPQFIKQVLALLQHQEAASDSNGSGQSGSGKRRAGATRGPYSGAAGSPAQQRLKTGLGLTLKLFFAQIEPTLRKKIGGASLVDEIVSCGFGSLINSARVGLLDVLLEEATRPAPAEILGPILEKATAVLLDPATAPSAMEVEWWLRVLAPVVRVSGLALTQEPHRTQLLGILQRVGTVVDVAGVNDSKLLSGQSLVLEPRTHNKVIEESQAFVRALLRGLVEVYPTNFSASSSSEATTWWAPSSFRNLALTSVHVRAASGASPSAALASSVWHLPSIGELELAALIIDTAANPVSEVLQIVSRPEHPRFNEVASRIVSAKHLEVAVQIAHGAVIGVASILPFCASTRTADSTAQSWWCNPKEVHALQQKAHQMPQFQTLRSRLMDSVNRLLRMCAQSSEGDELTRTFLNSGRLQSALLDLGRTLACSIGYGKGGLRIQQGFFHSKALLSPSHDKQYRRALGKAMLSKLTRNVDTGEEVHGGFRFHANCAPRSLRLVYAHELLRKSVHEGRRLLPAAVRFARRQQLNASASSGGHDSWAVRDFLELATQLASSEAHSDVRQSARALREPVLRSYPWHRLHLVSKDLDRSAAADTSFEEFMALFVSLGSTASVGLLLRSRDLLTTLTTSLLTKCYAAMDKLPADKRQMAKLGVFALFGRLLEKWAAGQPHTGALEGEDNYYLGDSFADCHGLNRLSEGEASQGDDEQTQSRAAANLRSAVANLRMILQLGPDTSQLEPADPSSQAGPRSTPFHWKETMLWLLTVTANTLAVAAASRACRNCRQKIEPVDNSTLARLQHVVVSAAGSETNPVRNVGFSAFRILLALSDSAHGLSAFRSLPSAPSTPSAAPTPTATETGFETASFASMFVEVLRRRHSDDVAHTADGRLSRRSNRLAATGDASDVAVSWMSQALNDLTQRRSAVSQWQTASRSLERLSMIREEHIEVLRTVFARYEGSAQHFAQLIPRLLDEKEQAKQFGDEGVMPAQAAGAEIVCALLSCPTRSAIAAVDALPKLVHGLLVSVSFSKAAVWTAFLQRVAGFNIATAQQFALETFRFLLQRIKSCFVITDGGGGGGAEHQAAPSAEAGFITPVKLLSFIAPLLVEGRLRYAGESEGSIPSGPDCCPKSKEFLEMCSELRDVLQSQVAHPFKMCRVHLAQVLCHVWDVLDASGDGATKAGTVALNQQLEKCFSESKTDLVADPSATKVTVDNAVDNGNLEKQALRRLEHSVETTLLVLGVKAMFGHPHHALDASTSLLPLVVRSRALLGAEARQLLSAALGKLAQTLRAPAFSNESDSAASAAASAALAELQTLAVGDKDSKVRKTAVVFLGTFLARNLMAYRSTPSRVKVRQLLVDALADKKPEVATAAGEVLVGVIMANAEASSSSSSRPTIAIASAPVDSQAAWLTTLIDSLRKLASTKLKRRPAKPTRKSLRLRLAGVIGFGAIAAAFPYDVPSFLPPVLVELSKHLSDPSPVCTSARKALAAFIKTHRSNWQQQRERFTLDEWETLNDVLASPDYYA